MVERYFDNAATTPVDARVIDEMLPYFGEWFGNANSIHDPGRRAKAAVDLARERVATLIGAEDASQIIFTSGATEANNWVLSKFAGSTTVISPFEHSSVRETAIHFGSQMLANEGYRLHPAPVGAELVSLMSVNNETGAILEFPDSPGALRHSDITQQVGKLPVNLKGLAFASFSGHKFYGPKGVGALYLADPTLEPLHFGGEHEDGLRAGTLNVPGIVGIGAASSIAQEEMETNLQHAQSLRALVLQGLENVSDIQLNSPSAASPYIVSMSFLGVEGETLVIELDRAGFSVSSGAACSSKSTEPSHVLTALGKTLPWIRGTIRISFGKYNTEAAAADLTKEIRKVVEKLRTMH